MPSSTQQGEPASPVVNSDTGKQSNRSGAWKPSGMPGGMASLANELAMEPTLRRNFDIENGGAGEIKPHIDATLLFGMERTFYSALNVTVTLVFFGLGLMMVSNINRKEFFAQGCTMASFCLLYMVFSWVTHLHRMQMLRRGQPVSIVNSIVYTSCLVCLICLVIAIELFYANKYPYMARSEPVIFNETPAPVATTAPPL